MRDYIFENNAIYHVFNRGVDKRTIIESDEEAERFLDCLRYFNTYESFRGIKGLSKSELEFLSMTNELVDIITYCLNPNHFHLLLRQKMEGGISKFMERVSQGYTQYFNRRNERSGSLFEGTFKARYVGDGDDFDYIATYVGRNDEVHRYRSDQKRYIKRGFDELLSSNGVCNDSLGLLGGKTEKEYILRSDQILEEIRENKLQASLRKELLTFD